MGSRTTRRRPVPVARRLGQGLLCHPMTAPPPCSSPAPSLQPSRSRVHAPPLSVPWAVVSVPCPSAPLQALSLVRTYILPHPLLSITVQLYPQSARVVPFSAPLLLSLSRSAVSVPPFASASASHFFALIVYSPTVNTLWSIYTIARFILIRRRPARLSVPRSPQPQPAPREPTSSWSSQRPSSYIATHAQVLLSPRSRSYGSPSVFPCAYGPRPARAHGLTLVPGAARDDDGDGVDVDVDVDGRSVWEL